MKASFEWHAANMGNDHQGLIIDDNGRNVAVAYDKADAPMIASAPAMADALRKFLELATDARCIRSIKWSTARDSARAVLAEIDGGAS